MQPRCLQEIQPRLHAPQVPLEHRLEAAEEPVEALLRRGVGGRGEVRELREGGDVEVGEVDGEVFHLW